METTRGRRIAWNTSTEAPKADVDNQKRVKKVSKQIMRPLVISMALFGLCHGDIVWNKSCSGKVKAVLRTTNTLYCCLVMCLVWFTSLKFFSVYTKDDEFGSDLLLRVGIHTWYILCALNATVCYTMCSKADSLNIYVGKLLNKIETSYNCTKAMACLRRVVVTCTLLAWASVLLNMFVYICTVDVQMLRLAAKPFNYDPNDTTTRVVTLVVSSIVQLYLSACNTFPGFLIYFIAMILYHMFKSLATQTLNDGQTSISQDVFYSRDLESLRRQHQLLCRLVSDADDLFSVYNATILFFGSGLILLLLYQVIWNIDMFPDTFSRISVAVWIADSLIKILVVSIGGSALSSMAHEPKKTIPNIDLTNVSTGTAIQAQMFLHKVTGPTIGFTALKLFPIDKAVIPSLIGILLTYFVVLLQFQQSTTPTASSQDNACNCSFLPPIVDS